GGREGFLDELAGDAHRVADSERGLGDLECGRRVSPCQKEAGLATGIAGSLLHVRGRLERFVELHGPACLLVLPSVYLDKNSNGCQAGRNLTYLEPLLVREFNRHCQRLVPAAESEQWIHLTEQIPLPVPVSHAARECKAVPQT